MASSLPVEPVLVSALLVRGRTACLRTGCLTPYAVEVMADDASRAGNGAQLLVTVAASTDAVTVGRLAERFGRLGTQGVRVRVVREGQPEWHHPRHP